MMAPAELFSLISPAKPELLVTVIVWVPLAAVDHSGAQPVRLTVTVLAAPVAAPGSAAIVMPAASAGTVISAPATSHGRPPATRSHWPSWREAADSTALATRCAVAAAAAAGVAVLAVEVLLAWTVRPAFTKAGMTTT